MPSMAELFESTFRDYETDGLPSSGRRQVSKAEARALGAALDAALSILLASGLNFDTKAEMDAALDYPANTGAQIPDGADGGVYRKLGAEGAGSWEKIADTGIATLASQTAALDQAAPLYTAAGGTANAITGSPARTHAAYVNNQLYVVRPTASNTATGVTFKVGSLAALPINEEDGGLPAVGRIKANETLILRYSPNFSGVFYIVAPVKPVSDLNVARIINCVDTETGTADAIVAVAATSEAAYSAGFRYRIRPSRTTTAGLPTFKLGSLAALPIQEETGEQLAPGRIRGFVEYELRYHASGWFNIISPKREPVYSANARRAVQMADMAGRSLRKAYLAANDQDAIARTTIYDKDFTVEADATAIKTARDDGAGNPTYVSLTHESSGGGSAVSTPGANGWWWDPNHINWGPGYLSLLAVINTASVSSGPLDDLSDVRNLRLTLGLEAENLALAEGSRMLVHFQTTIGVGPAERAHNFVHIGTILDEALGSKGKGMGWPPQADTAGGHLATLNASATVVVDFVPDDAFWMDLGTSRTRTDLYLPIDVETAMQRALANIQIVVLHDQTDLGTQTPPVRPTGTLRIKSLKVEKKT